MRGNYGSFSICIAILLKNRDYLPALITAIDEAQSEILMAFFLFKAGVKSESYPVLTKFWHIC